MEHPFTDVSNFILTEIQKARQWTANPGPQYADDPQALLAVMQRTLRQFGSVKLPQEQMKRLFETFQTEAQQFRQHHQPYIAHGAYDDVLKDIKSMLDNMNR